MNQQPQPKTAERDKAKDRFEAMAARIMANTPEDFGGAFVLVTPSGKVVESLTLDAAKDEIGFLAMAQGKLAVLVDEVKSEDQVRTGQYGSRR